MLVSVIVPVYNVEKYIARCMESILNQSFKEFEVILVDDGSLDDSGNICDQYALSDERVQVIHKVHNGLSEARNTGLKSARGEFVTYIDSDDFVSNDYLSTLLDVQTKNGCDIVSASFKIFYDNEDIKNIQQSDEVVRYTGREACRLVLRGELPSSSCNMLIRKSIAERHLFPGNKYHEDEFTTFRYYLATDKVCKVNRILYYYYQRESSIMHQFGQPVLDELESADNYCEICSQIAPELVMVARYRKYMMIHQILDDYPEIKEVYPEQYQEMVKYMKNYLKKLIFNPQESLHYKILAIKKYFNRKNRK